VAKSVEELSRIARWMLSTRHLLNDHEIALAHLKYFMANFVVTQDEHDNDNPFKKMPYEEYPHIEKLCEIYTYEQLICIAKSRQLMATWFWCAVMLWDAMFKKGRLNIIINKREDDADETIDRIRFIYQNLPEMFKTAIPADKTPQGQLGAYCKFSFDCNKSTIRGLPQNPDAIRKNTASNVFADETAFIERMSECYTALLPTVRGGGKLILNSTPKGQNFFCKIFNDLE